MHGLEAEVRRLIAAAGPAAAAVAAGRAGSGEAGSAAGTTGDGTTLDLAIEADEVFHAASTMKVPVVLELLRRVDAGALALDDTLPVRNAFASIEDGSPFALDPADDSETALYGRAGDRATLRELATLAITVSSNLATNLLVDLLGPDRVSATMAAIGVPALVVRRGVEDGPAYRAGRNNEVTARGLATLLDGIARGAWLTPASTAELLAMLRDQRFNEGIPAGLPGGTVVAHKTGSIARLYHDAGIVFPGAGAPWVLVVLTRGLDEDSEAPALVARIARAVHEAFTP